MSQIEEYVYQVNSNHATCVFDTEKDGLHALSLVAHYHGITIDWALVQNALRSQGFCEEYWPCTIERCKIPCQTKLM